MNDEKLSRWQRWTATATKRRVIVVLVIIVLIVATATGLVLRADRSARHSNTSATEDAKTVDPTVVTIDTIAQRNIGLTLEAAEIKTVVQSIQTTGSVGPNETRVVHLRPLARGRIEKVFVRLGDRVRAGQPLAAYDNIELGEWLSEYLKANAEADVAKRSLERAQHLVELGAIARADYDRRHAEYNRQNAEVAKIEEKLHRFGLTEADLDTLITPTHTPPHREASHSILRAPFDGTMIAYNVADGEVVDPERELFTIANLSTVWVQADVYEKDIAAIHEGQEVKVSVDAYPGEIFIGTVTYVSDVLDQKTRTAKVRCEVPNSDGRLKLEMFATIAIPTPMGREAVMIPASAVQQIDDRPVVFVRIGDGKFQKREVQLGAHSDGWVEVTRGVNAREIVVTRGSFYMKSLLLREQIGGEE